MKPTVQSFSTVIVAFAKYMNTARAVYWLETMAEAGMICDVTIYGIVLDACIKAADLLHEKQVSRLMCDSGIQPNTGLYESSDSRMHKSLIDQACGSCPRSWKKTD